MALGNTEFNLEEIMKEQIWKNHVNEAVRIANVNLKLKLCRCNGHSP